MFSKSYIEGVKEDQNWNLYHADLDSNADPHLQAAKEDAAFSNPVGVFHMAAIFNYLRLMLL